MEPEAMDTSGDHSVDSTRPKRITKACDICYNKKIKCDGATPQCNWCAHRGVQCSYERRVVRKRRSTKQHRSQLLDRVDRLERLLAKTLEEKTGAPLPRAASSGPSDSTTDASLTRDDDCNNESHEIATPLSIEQPVLGALHFAGWRLGSVNSTNGIPIFSDHGEQWIRSRTGEGASLARITALRQSWQSIVRSDSIHSVNLVNLNLPGNMPDRHVVEKCLALYSHSFVCRVFPVIDPVRFETTIATAYSSTPSHAAYDIYNAQACVFAFLAFISFFSLGQPTTVATNAELYTLTAQRILTTCSLAVTTETLQTSILLLSYFLFCGDLPTALVYDSITARLIYLLGAHTITYPSCTDANIVSANPSYRERYLFRNIFWLSYIFDKELALRTGQPPCLQDEHCDISFPPAYVTRVYSHMMGYGNETNYESMQLFPGNPWMGVIKSKAYDALYSTRALKKTDAELLRDIRELDDEIECWRLSVPRSHRPTVSFTRATLPENMWTMPSVMMHLDYNHSIAIVHQATSRCQAWSFGDHDDMAGVGTSLALSIEASRSSLVYLQIASHRLDENSFWMILYYPMSALMTLFYSILHRPLSPQAREDLELLKDVPHMMRRIPRSSWMESATRQIQAVDDLVEELTALAQSAIDKATRERTQ